MTDEQERREMAVEMIERSQTVKCEYCVDLGAQGISQDDHAASAIIDVSEEGVLVSRNGLVRATQDYANTALLKSGRPAIGCSIVIQASATTCAVNGVQT